MHVEMPTRQSYETNMKKIAESGVIWGIVGGSDRGKVTGLARMGWRSEKKEKGKEKNCKIRNLPGG